MGGKKIKLPPTQIFIMVGVKQNMLKLTLPGTSQFTLLKTKFNCISHKEDAIDL